MGHAVGAAPNMAAHAALDRAIWLLCAKQRRVDIEDEPAWREHAQDYFGIAFGNVVEN